MRNNLYICNANPQTKTTLTSPISGSNIGTHYIVKYLIYLFFFVALIACVARYIKGGKPYVNRLEIRFNIIDSIIVIIAIFSAWIIGFESY